MPENSCDRCRQLKVLIDVSPRLNGRTKQALQVLERRANFLKARASIREFNSKPASFDAQELAALEWSVLAIKSACAHNQVDESLAPDVTEEAVRSRVLAAQ